MQRMIRQITLDVDEGEMTRLQTLARHRDMDVEAMLRLALRSMIDSDGGGYTVQQPIVAYGALDENGAWAAAPHDPAEARAARIDALRASSGMVKENVALEIDGLAYQKALRAEWR